MDIAAFHQIHTQLATYQKLECLCEAILALMPQFGADFGLSLLQEDNGNLHFYSTLSDQTSSDKVFRRHLAHQLLTMPLVKEVIEQQKTEMVADLTTDPRTAIAESLFGHCRGAVLVPFQLIKAQAKGVLLFGRQTVGSVSATDSHFLEFITAQVCQHIESTLLYRSQAEHMTQLALINQVSRAATSILNIGLMQATVTQAIQRSFGFYRVSVYRYLSSEKILILDAYTGADGRTWRPETTHLIDSGIIAQVVEQRQTVVINDLSLDNRYQPADDSKIVKSKLVIPIKLGIKTIGILDLESQEVDAFSAHLVAALETMTDQLAIAIENARLYDDVTEKVNELMSLNHIIQAVSSSLNLPQILTLVTQHVTSMLNVAATSVALRDDEANEVWFAAASGEGSTEVIGLRMPLGQGVVGWVAETGEPIIVPDVSTDTRFFPDVDAQSGFTTKSILCVPMVSKGRLIGAIEAMNKRDDSAFTIQDLNLLADLTAPAATAIENAKLYEDLAQNMRQLEAAQVQLVQSAKLSAIGELAAGVAHEINNPLTSIIGLSAVIADSLDVDSEEAEDLHIVRSEAQRATKIVHSLLDFARVGDPVQSLADLNEILESAIFLAVPAGVRHKIKLTKSFADLPLIPVDQDQIKQVFINILNNAVFAMPNGGQLTVTSQISSTDSQMVCLSFADTGSGISPEHIDKIFDPFFTTKEVGQGTGLGLSVSYGIIERHNGQISLETAVGIGTTFHISLPITNA